MCECFSRFETAELSERRVRSDGSSFEGSEVTEASVR